MFLDCIAYLEVGVVPGMASGRDVSREDAARCAVTPGTEDIDIHAAGEQFAVPSERESGYRCGMTD